MSHLSLPRIHFQGGFVINVDTANLEALRAAVEAGAELVLRSRT